MADYYFPNDGKRLWSLRFFRFLDEIYSINRFYHQELVSLNVRKMRERGVLSAGYQISSSGSDGLFMFSLHCSCQITPEVIT
jgi:hypothetical protein